MPCRVRRLSNGRGTEKYAATTEKCRTIADKSPGTDKSPGEINRPAADQGEKILVVRVTADGKPVAGAQVGVRLLDDFQTALTNADGLARVPLPAGGKVNGVVALHPALGIGGGWFGFPTPAKPPTAGGLFQISLAPARPHTVRVVDAEGRPVPDLKCSVPIVLWSPEDSGPDVWPRRRSIPDRSRGAGDARLDAPRPARLHCPVAGRALAS